MVWQGFFADNILASVCDYVCVCGFLAVSGVFLSVCGGVWHLYGIFLPVPKHGLNDQ